MTPDASRSVKSSASANERTRFSRRFWQILMRIGRGIGLTLVYFAGIATFQIIQANADKTTRDIGIVVSTVMMVVLFQPLRTRLQTIIDRRFYRSTYDAARVIAAFTATLREEIDLDQLNERLITVVRETLLPSSVTLWQCATASD